MANLACIDSGNAHGRFLQYIQKDFYRVQIRQHGDAVLNRATADHSAVLVVNAGQDRPGVDDIAHIAGPDGVENLAAALADFAPNAGADAVFFQEVCRSGGGRILPLRIPRNLYSAGNRSKR